MFYKYVLVLLTTAAATSGQPTKCDHTPPPATVSTPSENDGLFVLNIANTGGPDEEGNRLYTSAQTYVLTLESTDASRPFRWYMITAEDPDVDNNIYDFGYKPVDVGNMKTTLDDVMTRYSERCANTVESYDNTVKPKVEVHWISPQSTERVRIRAMVAENSEVWYTGNSLTVTLKLDTSPSSDYPPIMPNITCNLCSEARYEVIFTGRWSRLHHPRHYPSKPDDNGYSHMVGASHDYKFTLWERGTGASPGLKQLAENADISLLEREIIGNMSETIGTRTLIRGKRRHHPHMHEPSHALFRVDRFHHLFSIAVAMKPSPDWFLGTKKFELCTSYGWLPYHEMPLYPWDAGTMDGVSYESPPSMTQPVNNIERVEVGSFNEESPFFQMNLKDLKPFAMLEVRRLDVYELDPSECSEGDNNNNEEEEADEDVPEDEPLESPRLAESRQNIGGCLGEWSEWSPCIPDVGGCGIGAQTRTRQKIFSYGSNSNDDFESTADSSCQANDDSNLIGFQHCFLAC